MIIDICQKIQYIVSINIINTIYCVFCLKIVQEEIMNLI